MFDYVGGSISGQILEEMPQNCEYVVVGNLSSENLSMSPINFISTGNKLRGLNMFGYLYNKEERDAHFSKVSNDFKDGGKIFGSDIYKELPLS